MKKSKQPFIRSGLFMQFALVVILVALVSLVMILGIYRDNTRKLLSTEVENKATVFLSGLEGAVRRIALEREPRVRLTDILDIRATQLKEYLSFSIIRMAVISPQGRIIDHTVPERIGQTHMNNDFKKALAARHPVVIREVKVMKEEPGSPEIPVIKIYYPVMRHRDEPIALIRMDVDVRRTMQLIRSEYGRMNQRVFKGIALTTFLMVTAILLILKRRIINPVAKVVRASEEVARGRLELLPAPKGKDEMARLIHSFNHMIEGLKQRDHLRFHLELAREVQQNLLPQATPAIQGLDIGGRSIYCESTGGDYYDYLYTDAAAADGSILVVVGDVSDHGIQSALLMATARSALHQCWMHAENLADIMSDINRQLVSDVEASGYFMTMFLIRIDGPRHSIQWANAGHDPGLVYDRNTDVFDELAGRGLALGVDAGAAYGHWQQALVKGQIFVVGTDGIWEARRQAGDTYGKQRLKAVVRKHAAESAQDIVAAIIGDVENFVAGPLEDDITVTVIKVKR